MRRTCLLTGASGPLGTAFLRAAAERYDIVAVHHRSPLSCATAEQRFVDPLEPDRELPENERAVHAVRADLRDPAEVASVAAEATDRLGPVDLVVNGAAVRTFAPAWDERTLDAAEDVMRVNVLAPLRLCAALAAGAWGDDPDANAGASRNVVNVSSTAGLSVYADLGQALYATSKAALNHLTYHLASELWDFGVRVNAVAPDTFPGRVATAAVVDAVLALDASEETGKVVPVCR